MSESGVDTGRLRRWANIGPEGVMQEHPLGEFVLLNDVRDAMAAAPPAAVTGIDDDGILRGPDGRSFTGLKRGPDFDLEYTIKSGAPSEAGTHDEAERWYAEARHLEGKLEQAYRAYEVVAAERDGYRNLLHKFAEVQADAEMLKPRTVIVERTLAEMPPAAPEFGTCEHREGATRHEKTSECYGWKQEAVAQPSGGDRAMAGARLRESVAKWPHDTFLDGPTFKQIEVHSSDCRRCQVEAALDKYWNEDGSTKEPRA